VKKLRNLFFCLSCVLIYAEQNELTTSVIIPCYYKHAQYLENLLHEFSEQTSLPDEVVISISEAHKLKAGLVNKLENHIWPFELIIMQTDRPKWAGENRNIAAENSSGDILICQDADDLPHPQRIEIIKKIFKTLKVDYLIHYCCRLPFNKKLKFSFHQYKQHIFACDAFIYRQLPTYNLSHREFNQFLQTSLKDSPFEESTQQALGSQYFYGIHFGNCALRQNVFGAIKWTDLARTQDVKFCQDVCNNFANRYIINLPLVLYVKNRTSLQYLYGATNQVMHRSRG